MTLNAGVRLGPYEIASQLGAGGMGEVYRARDTRLEREVAVKLLPSEMAADRSRRQRFEHEAKAIAALNHPNIVAIYDTGEHNGLLYLVTELVDGESLRGASLTIRKTLDLAAQITDGLAAAHSAGITHRDLKPDNIMVTRASRVKILDFGLAKMEVKPTMGSSDATMTELTHPGTVMGTAGYMSPEQVRAQPLDHRSDIFSFGIILHELLSGKRAFQRASPAETMAAIVKDEAPELPDSVPAGLRLIVTRCLEKDAVHRFDSARDLGFALRTLSQTPVSSGQIAGQPQAAWGVKWIVAAAIAIGFLAVGLLAGRRLWPVSEAPAWSGSVLGGPPMAHAARLSPDGQMLGFLSVVDRMSQVGVMTPDSGNWRILTGDRANGVAATISWSPDGTRIYYDRFVDVPAGVYSVPVLGGERRLVLEGAAVPEALPDGSLLVARYNTDHRYQLHRFWPETGRLEALPAILGSGFIQGGTIRSFPGGSEALFVGSRIGDTDARAYLSAIQLSSGRVRKLWDQPIFDQGETSLSISKDGSRVFLQLRAEGAYRFVSIPSGGGAPTAVLSLLNRIASSDWGANGHLFLGQADRPVEVLRFPAAGGRPEILSTIPGGDFVPALPLPDGRVLMPFPLGDKIRLVVAGSGAAPRAFVETQEQTSGPFALVGDREVAFLIGPPARPSIAFASVSDGRILQRLGPLDGPVLSLAAAPGGTTLYYTSRAAVWEIQRAGGQPRKLRAGDYVAAHPAGGELLVQSNERDRFRLTRIRLDGGPEREIPLKGDFRLTLVPLASNAISRDGRIVAAVTAPDYWFWQVGLIHPETGVITLLPLQIDGDINNAGWSADGRIVATASAFRASIWRLRPIRP